MFRIFIYFVSYIFLFCIFVEIYMIALIGNYNNLRLHCSLGKILVSLWFIWCPSADADASAEAFSLLVWRPITFSCVTSTEQRHRATHLSIISIFPHTFSFAILYPSTSIMCFQTIPIFSQQRSNITHRQQQIFCKPAPYLYIFYYTSFFLHGSLKLLVSCQQSRLHFCFFFTIHTQHSTLSILGLTENWIRPEDSATPADLFNNLSFSHTPCQVGRCGNYWKYSTHSPLCNYNSLESHAITVIAPIKLQIVVIYRPPGQILATFLEELDGLLSSFMEDGTPLLVFGDFNINLDKPYTTDFNSLLV